MNWRGLINEEQHIPGEKGSTVAFIFSSATSFRVSLPIRLNCVDLGAFLTLPLLLTVLPAVVFLDPRKISKCPRRMVMNTRRFRAHIGSLFNLFAVPLLQLPWKVVASPV